MIHFFIATRAQLFKMAPIMRECESRGLEWRWIYAAMHKETFKQTLDFFELPDPDYTIVKWDNEAKTLGKMGYWFSRMVLAMGRSNKILDGYTGQKHIILTHGDTPATPFGGLVGKLTKTHVMHVESGLRSFNIFHPFPEELCRLITFRLSDYFACPGEWALGNVKKYKGAKINTIENTQIDVLRYGLDNLDKATIKLPKKKYVVLSTHRYENVFKKERLRKIIEFTELAAKKYTVLIIQHPVTRIQIDKLGHRKRLESNQNIKLLPRLEYENNLKAIKDSEFVMTDGGGNQEELYHMGKPTLILRNATERQEGIGSTAVLSNLDDGVVNEFIKNYKKYRREPTSGKLSPTKIIVDRLQKDGFGG